VHFSFKKTTYVGYNFNSLPENQLTKFRAVETVLRQNIVDDQGFGGLSPPSKSPSRNFAYDYVLELYTLPELENVDNLFAGHGGIFRLDGILD